MTFNAGALPASIAGILIAVFVYTRRHALVRASDQFWGTQGRSEKSVRRLAVFTTVMCTITITGSLAMLFIPIWG